MPAASPDEARARLNEVGWFHHVDLGNGVVTPGAAAFSWRADQFPSVAGRSVLDIGAWDGGYSYLAEREGAARVVALDDYVWGINFAARIDYWNECAAQGVLPDHDRDRTDFWDPTLPGKRGFDLAHELIDSSVESVVADFMTTDLDALGTFDVVFYLGVLYHMKEPFTALERVRRVTGDVAAIETVALNIPGRNDERLLRFHAGDELGADFGNWFELTEGALRAMCLAAGFKRVEVVVGPPAGSDVPDPAALLPLGVYRTLVHAYV